VFSCVPSLGGWFFAFRLSPFAFSVGRGTDVGGQLGDGVGQQEADEEPRQGRNPETRPVGQAGQAELGEQEVHRRRDRRCGDPEEPRPDPEAGKDADHQPREAAHVQAGAAGANCQRSGAQVETAPGYLVTGGAIEEPEKRAVERQPVLEPGNQHDEGAEDCGQGGDDEQPLSGSGIKSSHWESILRDQERRKAKNLIRVEMLAVAERI